MSALSLRVLRLLGLGSLNALFCLSLSACLFSPPLAENGYSNCEADADCEAGRACQIGICAPPPWFDETYAERRLLVVNNPSADETLAAGTAVLVTIGNGGLYPVESLGADARFVSYDAAADPDNVAGAGWTDVPVHRQLENDRLFQWMRVPTSVPPQSERVLAWQHRDRLDGEILLVENATEVFSRYEDFAGAELGVDPAAWRIDGTGDATLSDGLITLRDNTQIFALEELVPPFALTVTGRINGQLCDALFLGVQGDDFVGSVPPYAGFFFQAGLDATLDVVPTAESQPGPLDFGPIETPTAKHRFTIEVNAGRVRLLVDEEEFAARDDLIPPMTDDPLTFTIDVDGDCAFELESIWVTTPPFVTPTVRSAEPVRFAAFE